MGNNKVERAKELGWSIECVGDQQDGMWNWLLWPPDNGYAVQTERPMPNEAEAWEYFYSFVLGLPGPTTDVSAASGTASAGRTLAYVDVLSTVNNAHVVNRAYVADHVAAGDFDSVWAIIEALEVERDAARLERDRMVCAVLFWNAQDGVSAADRSATTAMHEMADTLNMKYGSCVNVKQAGDAC